MKEIRRLLRLPKIQLAEFLTLIFISAFLFHPSALILWSLVVSVVTTVLTDILLLRLRKIKFFFPSASIVTGLIIALITGPNLPWYEVVSIGTIAMISKHFLRIKNNHVFNPAAFGIFIESLLFGHTVSWWAVSWQQFSVSNFQFLISFIILFLPFLISGIKMRRSITILSFVITYLLLTRRLLFDPTVVFFSLVMLPEPMTTPAKPKQQLIFGVVVGLFTFGASLPIFSFVSDPLLFALLVGNVIYFTYNYFRKAGEK